MYGRKATHSYTNATPVAGCIGKISKSQSNFEEGGVLKAIVEIEIPEDVAYEIRTRKIPKRKAIKAIQDALNIVLEEDLPEHYATVIDLKEE